MSLRKPLLSMITMIMLPGVIVFGQQSQTPPADGERSDLIRPRDGHRPHMRRGQGLRRWGRDLNLTPEQQEQLRAIVQRKTDATRAQREELFALREKGRAGALSSQDEARLQTLRQEIRESMKGIREEMLTLLTTEQRATIEAREQERKARREQKLHNRPESPPNQ